VSARTVVVGAGAAGLWCALHAVDRGAVTVVAPGAAELTATAWAQGGIAAVSEPDDSPERHATDTVTAGAGLCDLAAVEVLVREAPEALAALRSMGMAFDEGGPTLEGGHSRRRVHHAGGDRSGMFLHRFLAARVSEHPGIVRVDARVVGIHLAEGVACGVRVDGGAVVAADRVVLATGGACGIFGRRTGPRTSIGGGFALAWQAGAALADLEFVQFHPTALDMPGEQARLFTEALRGEGAVLLDAEGRSFMERFHPLGDLAPRDVVARAVLSVRDETGRVYLDATSVPDVADRFPTAAEQCAAVGLDIGRDRIPVAPAAHYFMGGVLTDLWGRTTVQGLFAAGEVTSTGLHGANRLASNSLAEALVFGRRAAIAEDGPTPGAPDPTDPIGPTPAGAMSLAEIRELTDRFLEVRRDGPELRTLVKALDEADDPDGVPAATLVAWLIAHAALRRTESRGGHYRVDHPRPDPTWQFRQAVARRGWWALASAGAV
jgi:L-aspartate oxidase